MKRFCLFLVLAVLFLGACQKNDACMPENGGDAGEKDILWMIKKVSPETRSVAETAKLWQPGDVVRIKFQNGDATLQEKVKLYAAGWLAYANLVFEYVGAEEESDVKIGFNTDSRWLAWATVGTDCRLVAQDAVSLNFVDLDAETEAGIKAEILRGFGHVLGLGFEHRNPDSPVRFKDPLDVADEYGLSEADVQELISQYSTDQTNYTAYDKASVMVITIPRSLVTNRLDATTRNTDLSDMDKEFIAGVYPYGEMPIVKMVTAKQSVLLTISSISNIEVDWGDGMREVFPQNMYVMHSYTDGLEHTIRFYGSDTTLIRLDCTDIQLSFLDVSKNKALKSLHCGNNELTSIDVSHNLALEDFTCYSNRLTRLDVSKNLALIMFSCENNQLVSLNISKNIRLQNASCARNLLATIDISNNTALTNFYCNSNQLTSLDVSKNTLLDYLYCYNNSFTSLDLSHNPLIANLSCSGNSLKTLDVSNNPDLRLLSCSGNQLTFLDVSKNPKLKSLWCNHNQLNSLDISKNSLLTGIDINNNPFVYVPEKLTQFANDLPDVNHNMDKGRLFLRDQAAIDLISAICEAKYWEFSSQINEFE